MVGLTERLNKAPLTAFTLNLEDVQPPAPVRTHVNHLAQRVCGALDRQMFCCLCELADAGVVEASLVEGYVGREVHMQIRSGLKRMHLAAQLARGSLREPVISYPHTVDLAHSECEQRASLRVSTVPDVRPAAHHAVAEVNMIQDPRRRLESTRRESVSLLRA